VGTILNITKAVLAGGITLAEYVRDAGNVTTASENAVSHARNIYIHTNQSLSHE
jgi:hypothetical protein